MDRCALFVDASYLLADGAMAVHGTRHREAVSWDFPGLLKFLNNLAHDRTGLRLLRCYWYEATTEGRRTPEHDALADLPGLKLRLGRMRPGRREGVDTHVYRDLLTLAREHAICDAVLVSGDEDTTQAVSDAQDIGIRVTVVHVAVDGNWTISRSLRHECDDLIEISSSHLRPFVNLLAGTDTSSPPLSNGQSQAPSHLQPAHHAGPHPAATHHTGPHPAITFDFTPGHPSSSQLSPPAPAPTPQPPPTPPSSQQQGNQTSGPIQQPPQGHQLPHTPQSQQPHSPANGWSAQSGQSSSLSSHSGPMPSSNNSGGIAPNSGPIGSGPMPSSSGPMPYAGHSPDNHSPPGSSFASQQPQDSYGNAQMPQQASQAAPTLSDAVNAAHQEGSDFGESVARDAPALWLEAVLARKPRMPSDLEARLLQGSSLPIDFLLHDEVRHALRRGFWDALERTRRSS